MSDFDPLTILVADLNTDVGIVGVDGNVVCRVAKERVAFVGRRTSTGLSRCSLVYWFLLVLIRMQALLRTWPHEIWGHKWIIPLHFFCILIKESSPLFLVLFTCIEYVSDIWKHLNNWIKSRLDNCIDESNLRLGYVSSFSIVEQTHREAVLLFQVTLRKEFHKEQISPQSAQLEILGRIRNVRHVENHFNQQLLVSPLIRLEVSRANQTFELA